MTYPHPPPQPAPLPDRFNERLNRLRDRFRELAPDRPEGLDEVRAELDALRIGAADHGRDDLGTALQRLIHLTEVWECLAAERPESASEAASFCVRALEGLGSAEENGPIADVTDTSWILRESSAFWSDYLALIDPGSAADLADNTPAPIDSAELDVEIDAATLVKMLTGGAISAGNTPAEPAPAKAAQPPSRSDGSPAREPERHSPPREPLTTTPERSVLPRPKFYAPKAALEIDPDCREAFLSEALDLFERIQSLVLGLDRGTSNDQASTLSELGRCFHTLKGAAGSVGLLGLASQIHQLEQGLEDAAGQLTPRLRDQLHEALSQLEGILDSLRHHGSGLPGGPGSGDIAPSVPEAPEPPPAPARTIAKLAPTVEEDKPPGNEPPAPTDSNDGPVRIPSGRMDELMDLASELIMRRGAWATQAERLKKFAAMIRTGRNELRVRFDRLNELAFARASRPDPGPLSLTANPRGAAIDDSSDLATVVLRLAEQVEDLVVLTETAQAQALPLADDSDTLARLTLQLWETLQSIRIIPIRGLFQRLARVAHDAARIEGRAVEVEMIGEETGLDRAVQDKAFEPLLHIVRNAVGHGLEPPADRAAAGKPTSGRVTLEAHREGNTLVLSVQDDGRGLDYVAIEEKGRRLGLLGPDDPATPERLGALIFRSGFSTRPEANAIAGRGVGMDAAAQEVRRLRGTIDLTSQQGVGTRITIRLPARLALEQAMITRVAGQTFAIPISVIEHAQPFEPGDVDGTGSNATVRVRDRRVPLIVAREALGFSATAPASCPKLLLVRAEGEPLALLLDAIEGTRELVIKPLVPLLAGHPVIWGTSLSLTGDVIFVLNPSGLFRWFCEGRAFAAKAPDNDTAQRLAPVLVVDDSISVRHVVTRQLRMLGLEVEEVSNGIEALSKLSSRSYSMVLTDLEMPRMDGFELLAELRRLPALAALPVVVASTESRLATRRRVLALGARAFVAKPIDQDELARVAGSLLNRPVSVP